MWWSAEALFQICDNVLGVFNANGQTHHVWSCAGLYLLFFGQLAMRGGGGVYDQRTRIPDIGKM